MKGKLVTQTIKLDYTNVAEPLRALEIHDDIQECLMRYCASPEVLVLWEHQLDWLRKNELARVSAEYVFGESVPGAYTKITHIYGVPIEERTRP